MRLLIILVTSFFLISCVAPKPKTVSGKKRVPINTTEIVIPQPEKKPPVVIAKAPGPVVFTFHFPFKSTAFSISNDELYQILPLALSAKQIHIRGRTDNTKESDFDLKVAEGRAIAARNLLIEKGVNPNIIYLNYSSASDYISENVTPGGRSKNRRVEILIY